MNILVIIGMIIASFILVCVCMAGIFIFIGYTEELNLVDRFLEYGAKLAKRRKGR